MTRTEHVGTHLKQERLQRGQSAAADLASNRRHRIVLRTVGPSYPVGPDLRGFTWAATGMIVRSLSDRSSRSRTRNLWPGQPGVAYARTRTVLGSLAGPVARAVTTSWLSANPGLTTCSA